MQPATKPVVTEPIIEDRAPSTPVSPAVLEEVLAEIARDVRVDPETYLEQSRVPGGGE